MLTESELRKNLKDFPTLPAIALRITEAMGDSRSSAKQVSDLIRQDQSLATRVLRLANSSYYAIPGGVPDIQKALAFLGFSTISQIVLSVSVVSIFPEKSVREFSLGEFWKHALGVAVIAEVNAKKTGEVPAELAFTAGLLHDIGKLSLFLLAPEQLSQIAVMSKETGKSFIECELELGTVPHTALGRVIGEQWKLPKPLLNALEVHHPESVKNDVPETALSRLIHKADRTAIAMRLGHSGNFMAPEDLDLLLSGSLKDEVLEKTERAFAVLHV
jgi:putative nucleotidyltransferase with HDIG domain